MYPEQARRVVEISFPRHVSPCQVASGVFYIARNVHGKSINDGFPSYIPIVKPVCPVDVINTIQAIIRLLIAAQFYFHDNVVHATQVYEVRVPRVSLYCILCFSPTCC